MSPMPLIPFAHSSACPGKVDDYQLHIAAVGPHQTNLSQELFGLNKLNYMNQPRSNDQYVLTLFPSVLAGSLHLLVP